MTAADKETILVAIVWCINRLRKEGADIKVVDEVTNRLFELMDWTCGRPIEEDGHNKAR